jgi:hypothetical protein
MVEAIARGELDDELTVLGAVSNERVRLLATAQSMTTWPSLRVGDRVRINHNAKPNYLHGRAGTVSKWAGQNVVVQLDQQGLGMVRSCLGGQVRIGPPRFRWIEAQQDDPADPSPARQELLSGDVRAYVAVHASVAAASNVAVQSLV